MERFKDPLNPTLAEAWEVVAALVADFAAGAKLHLSGSYSEAQARRDFIDRFLMALGWDVNHELQKDPCRQEVQLQRAVQTATAQRRADYALALAPDFDSPVLYVEAKPPGAEIATPENCFQIIRYANQSGHTIGLLTSFEQLLVIDCRYQAHLDTATRGVVQAHHFRDYADRQKFAAIFHLVARPEVAQGAIAKYAAALPKPKPRRGRATLGHTACRPIDELLLETLDRLRQSLAGHLGLRNPALDCAAVAGISRRILDRLVLIRFLQDRLIEPAPVISRPGQALAGAWRDFIAHCRLLDETYPDIVFQRHATIDDPDRLTVDDQVFAGILDQLDYHRSRFLFNGIPIHVLGSIYERSLGTVMAAAPRPATLKSGPAARKSGGVYYTPQSIVDDIVANTVGKLIVGKTPAEIAPMRFADIACGAGSFLLGAYDCLLKYVAGWYREHPRGVPPGAVATGDDRFSLSLEERGRILAANIYGVDIDPQAIEVTRLSLYLKLLEGETAPPAGPRPRLPSLAGNIRCGNSIVGPDFSAATGLDPDAVRNVNPFDWGAAFPAVFQRGGFDAVLGNPPYVDSERMTGQLKSTRDYCATCYSAASGNWDLFCVFSQQAIQLCRPGGLVSFIVPNKLGSADYARDIRRLLTVENRLLAVRDYSQVPVFPVAAYPVVFLVSKEPPPPEATVFYERMAARCGAPAACVESRRLPYGPFFARPGMPWEIFGRLGDAEVIAKMRSFPSLESVASVLGAATVAEAYQIQDLISEAAGQRRAAVHVVNSGTIDRYRDRWGEKPLRYLGRTYACPVVTGADLERLPAKRRSQALTPKIIVAGMTRRLECMIDLEGSLLAGKSTSLVFPQLDACYLLAILNSKAVSYFYSAVFGGNKLQAGYLRVGPPQLRKVPVPVLDLSRPRDKSRHDQLVRCVRAMLALQRRLAGAQARRLIQRRIDAVDRRIDRIVYQLYGLTEAEAGAIEALAADQLCLSS